jgi:exodeoxyribonuclease VII small subunit
MVAKGTLTCRVKGNLKMAQKTFEQSMKQLERIVQELEEGDLPLEKAIKKFEQGIKLSKLCSEKLDETEKKISVLLKNSEGQLTEKPISAEDETADD